jgi:hypothetical protein
MKPGDKVICIDDSNWYSIPVMGIHAGSIYTVKEVFNCKCGNVYVHLIELDIDFNMWCEKCNIFSYTRMFFHIERFQLLSDQAEDTEKEFENVKIQLRIPS